MALLTTFYTSEAFVILTRCYHYKHIC